MTTLKKTGYGKVLAINALKYCNILLPQRPSKVRLDAIKAVAQNKYQAQGKGSFIMWLGKLLTMVVQKYHRAFSRKVVLRLGHCMVEEFLEI